MSAIENDLSFASVPSTFSAGLLRQTTFHEHVPLSDLSHKNGNSRKRARKKAKRRATPYITFVSGTFSSTSMFQTGVFVSFTKTLFVAHVTRLNLSGLRMFGGQEYIIAIIFTVFYSFSNL